MYLYVLFLSSRPIPTKPGSTKPTSEPQRCWAVAKLLREVLWLPFPSPLYLQQCTCAFHPTGLHTCTHQPLYALSRKCRRLSVLTDSLVNGHIYSVSFSPKVKCTFLMARAHMKFLLLLLLFVGFFDFFKKCIFIKYIYTHFLDEIS